MIKNLLTLNCLNLTGLSLLALSLSACASPPKVDPNDFSNPNRVITKKISVPLPTPKVAATFGFGNNPQVLKAYKEFTKKGIARTINSEGFKTFAYDAYSRPIVTCAPLHLCVLQLEHGETINNIDLGDTAHWLVSTSLVGSAQDGSYQITVKPKLYDMATDMVITTNKRAYNIGLVSQQGASTHVVNFYYPQETLTNAIQQAKQRFNSPLQQEVISRSTQISVDEINFNYQLRGDSPSWKPTRVFDDGNKTFIQMPAIAERLDLPVLYVLRNKAMEIVNYRYKKPYYIVDGLFAKAYLFSGKGINQARVEIDNQNFG